MNKIDLLYKEAVGKDWTYEFDPDIAHRFADLIINECINAVITSDVPINGMGYYAHQIRKRFEL